MKNKSNLTFIINPAAGKGAWKKVQKEINEYCVRNGYEAEYFFSGDESETRAVLEEREKQGTPFVFVMGGDGTINELARNMVGMNMALGIIPTGSGNGLARYLGITKKGSRLLNIIRNHRVLEIDFGLINGKHFFTTAGVGFDAEVGNEFNTRGRKGFTGYINTFIREFKEYVPIKVTLDINGVKEEHNVFSMTIANGNQFGNSAIIAPGASITDGLVDVVLVRPFPLIAIPALVFRLFTGTIHKSRYVKIIPCKSLSADLQKPGNLHYDGETESHIGAIRVCVGDRKLRVLVHEDFSEKSGISRVQ